MGQKEQPEKKDVVLALFTCFALTGILLLLTSILLSDRHKSEFGQALTRELGIVLLSVFSVSLAYELWLGARYVGKFRSIVSEEIERSLKASQHAELGITRIYSSRVEFDNDYPLHDLVAKLGRGSTIRFVGVTLFHLMNNFGVLREALQRGATVQLCLLSLDVPAISIRDKSDLDLADIATALREFRKNIRDWISNNKPLGSIEVRCHWTPLFDSFFEVNWQSGEKLGALDMSFGRDPKQKSVIVVDPTRCIGNNLSKRYLNIWNNAEPDTIFRYRDRTIEMEFPGVLGS